MRRSAGFTASPLNFVPNTFRRRGERPLPARTEPNRHSVTWASQWSITLISRHVCCSGYLQFRCSRPSVTVSAGVSTLGVFRLQGGFVLVAVVLFHTHTLSVSVQCVLCRHV